MSPSLLQKGHSTLHHFSSLCAFIAAMLFQHCSYICNFQPNPYPTMYVWLQKATILTCFPSTEERRENLFTPKWLTEKHSPYLPEIVNSNPNSQTSPERKIGHAGWVGRVPNSLFPIGHSNTSQSWGSVSSCMWKKKNSTFFWVLRCPVM